MSQLRIRRGSTLAHNGDGTLANPSFTGDLGEVTFNTDTNALVTHDGATAGGFPHIKVGDLAAPSGASLVGYMPAGAEAVVNTVQGKGLESVSIGDYSSLQAALNTGKPVEITAGVWTVTGGAVLAANARIYGAGTLQSDGVNPVITIPAGSTGVVIEGVNLKGFRLTSENATLDIGILVQESGAIIRNCDIGYFASRGIELASQVANAFEHQSLISGNRIHNSGIGINTNAYEYCRIDSNIITKNGWNNAGTGFAPLSASLGAGIYGNCANIPITNNQIVDNAFGIYLIAGSAAPNPDHSIIGFNSINHNGAAGLVLVDLKSYEMVIGNTIISNVNVTPAVVYAATGTTVDMALVNAHGLVFTANTVGTGSDNKISIFGHGRCRYTNNQFLYGPPTEVTAPLAGSPLKDTWGYTVNADNIWRDNWFFTFTKPVLLAGTTRTMIEGNLENSALVDTVQYAATPGLNWATPGTGYMPIKYWRESGNVVRIVGSLQPSASFATIAFTLPMSHRPNATVDAMCLISNTGTAGYLRIYSNGDVQPIGAVAGSPVIIDATFTI